MLTLVNSRLGDFLFNVNGIKNLALMRIVLGTTLLYLAVSRQLNMDQFTHGSIIPRADALFIYPEFYRPSIQFFFWPDQNAWIMHLIYIGLLALMIVGLSNRFFIFVTWVLAQGFINRNYSMLFGADLIGNLFLLYITFTNCNEIYTFRNYFVKKKTLSRDPSTLSKQMSSVFYRLMQIQLGVIYAYTGFEKLKGTTWWDGTALWTVFANPQFVNYDFIYLRNFPVIFSVGTFLTIIFEVYFPAMMLFRTGRLLWLALGLLFHTQIGLLMSLVPFSAVMCSVYFLYLSERDIDRLIEGLKRYWLKFGRRANAG